MGAHPFDFGGLYKVAVVGARAVFRFAVANINGAALIPGISIGREKGACVPGSPIVFNDALVEFGENIWIATGPKLLAVGLAFGTWCGCVVLFEFYSRCDIGNVGVVLPFTAFDICKKAFKIFEGTLFFVVVEMALCNNGQKLNNLAVRC